MVIMQGGAVYLNRNIIFENNTADIHNHPTMVLYSTNSDDEYAYVLQMTTDKKRARINSKIYTPLTFEKKSFLNLSNIIEVANKIISNKYSFIDLVEYKRVLEEFYQYQSNEGNNEKFNKIKSRIEVLVEMLEAANGNEELMEDFIDNTYMQQYLANNKSIGKKTKQIIIEMVADRKLGKRGYSYNEAEGNFKIALKREFDNFSTYIQKNSYLENDDLNDVDSKNYLKMKEYYNRMQSTYGMVNVNQLILAQIGIEYSRDDKSKIKIKKLRNMEAFIEGELERNFQKQLKMIKKEDMGKIMNQQRKKAKREGNISKRKKKYKNVEEYFNNLEI